jgi:hypothetical protein
MAITQQGWRAGKAGGGGGAGTWAATLLLGSTSGGTDANMTTTDKITFGGVSSISYNGVNKTIIDSGNQLVSFEGSGSVQWLNASTSLGLGESPSSVERFRTTIGGGTFRSAHRLDVSHDGTGTWQGLQVRSTTPKTNVGVSATWGVNASLSGVASAGTHEYIGVRSSVSGGTANYSVQLQDGTEALNYVLTSVTADGKSNWVNPNTLIAVSPLTAVLTAGSTMTGVQSINSDTGGGQIVLGNASNTAYISNDSGGFGRGWWFVNNTDMQTGFGATNYIEASANRVRMRATASTASYFSANYQWSKVGTSPALGAETDPFRIFRTDLVGETLLGSSGSRGVMINCVGSTVWTVGVDNTVAIAATGGAVKTSNALYTTNIAFISSAHDFESILSTAVLTADRTYGFKNASGDVSTRVYATVNTSNAAVTVVDTIDTLTDDTSHLINVTVTFERDTNVSGGVWDISLWVTRRAAVTVIESSQVNFQDDDAVGIAPNDVTFNVVGDDVTISVVGNVAENFKWDSSYEIVNQTTN